MAMNWMGGKRKRLDVMQNSQESKTRKFFETQRKEESSKDMTSQSKEINVYSEMSTDFKRFSGDKGGRYNNSENRNVGSVQRKDSISGTILTSSIATKVKKGGFSKNGGNRIVELSQQGQIADSSLHRALIDINDTLKSIKTILEGLAKEGVDRSILRMTLKEGTVEESEETQSESTRSQKTKFKKQKPKKIEIQPSDTLYFENSPLEKID